MIERLKTLIAFRLAPRWLVYWCTIRAGAEATSGLYGADHPDDVSIMDVLKRIEGWA